MSNFTKDSTAAEVATVLAAQIAGKVVLITGCSPKGLGATAAMAMASHKPALIILAGRTRSLIEETEKSILAQTPDVNIRLLIFDLASLKSVREAAVEVNKYPANIDVLINNAGIMATPLEKTVDGFESQFGVNHLGHFLFTMLILGKIPRGGRIVNVSSAGYAFGGVRFDDPNFEVMYHFASIHLMLTIPIRPVLITSGKHMHNQKLRTFCSRKLSLSGTARRVSIHIRSTSAVVRLTLFRLNISHTCRYPHQSRKAHDT
jgi:NAD(P)-dependent dehydrogenase (short-subunit alcohol dehydrogenase family)